MFFLKLGMQFLRLVVILWMTISFVFLLSQLLPTNKAPKGMQEAESAVYGSTDLSISSRIRKDYLKRRGLDQPLFYFTLVQYGKVAAERIPSAEEDKSWIINGVMRHGVHGTLNFYSVWQKWTNIASENDRKQLLRKLLIWSEQEDYSSSIIAGREITKFLNRDSSQKASLLSKAWFTLQKNSSPLYYHLPTVKWNGSFNIYHQWLRNICQGKLGFSTQDHTPVFEKVKVAFNISASLALTGLLMAVILSFLAGLHFSQHPYSVFTLVSHKLLYLLDSIPGFLIALIIFGVYLSLGGSLLSPLFEESSANTFDRLLNPAVLLGSICIALLVIPHLSLQFTKGLLEQKNKFYYRTALGKGISLKKAMWKHALPNTLVPTLTLLSEVIISLVAGVLVVEITFSLPGIGSLFTNSILNADYPVMVGLTLILLVFRLVVVWLVDFAFIMIDPRMKSN